MSKSSRHGQYKRKLQGQIRQTGQLHLREATVYADYAADGENMS